MIEFYKQLDKAGRDVFFRRVAGTDMIYTDSEMQKMFGPYLSEGIHDGLSVREIKLIETVQYLRADLADRDAVIERLEARVDEPCDDCATTRAEKAEAENVALKSRIKSSHACAACPERQDNIALRADLAEARALLTPAPATCTWTFDLDGFWRSKCGETWFFDSGTPAENNMRFCIFCGQRVSIATEGGKG